MRHLDTFGNDKFNEEFEGYSDKCGEAADLANVSFLTDPNPDEEWDGSEFGSSKDGGSPIDSLPMKDPTIEKSAPKNSKENYDIRGRAGFFSRKMASSSSLDLAGPLVYPKEFPEPKAQRSKRAQAEVDAADIAKLQERSHPKSGVRLATPSNSRYTDITYIICCCRILLLGWANIMHHSIGQAIIICFLIT